MLIPFLYSSFLGYIALRIASHTLATEKPARALYLTLFLLLSATGFVISNISPLPTLTFGLVTLFSLYFFSPKGSPDRIALFLFLLPILPMLDYDMRIGSTAILWLTWPRLLILLLLLPLFFRLMRRQSLLIYPTDKFIWLFFLLNAALVFRDTSLTNGIRNVLYLVIEVLMPYFVISRSIRTPDDIRKCVKALLSALLVVACICIFEVMRDWNMYTHLVQSVTGHQTFFIGDRVGFRRAYGPLDRPSQASLGLAFGIGLLWMASPYARSRLGLLLMLGILFAGMIATFARGGWVAAALIGLGFLLTSKPGPLFRYVLVTGVAGLIFAQLPIASSVISILPFVAEEGTHAEDTVRFRESLFDTSIRIAHQAPILGTTDYVDHPWFDPLRESSGFIDLVNHYVIVLLSTGYAGLISYLLVFFSIFLCILKQLLSSSRLDTEKKIFLLASGFTIAGLMLTLATTSASRGGLLLYCLFALIVASSTMAWRKPSSRPLPQQTYPPSVGKE